LTVLYERDKKALNPFNTKGLRAFYPEIIRTVSAISANSMKVVFSQAPVDTAKVVFTVLNGTAPVTVAGTWNEAMTEATLTKSSNFVAGTFTVNVNDNNSDLGTKSVTITEQKVAKIDITSTKLGVTM